MNKKTIHAVIAAVCSMSAIADYTITSDTVYGDGSQVTWGESPFTGDFDFDFSGGGDSLSFANRILLNGNNVHFPVPNNKTAYLAGGLTNNVAYASAGDTECNGALLRGAGTGKGTLVVSNCFDNIRLQLRAGTTVFEGPTSGFTNKLYYADIFNQAVVEFNGGCVRSLGEFYLRNGTVTMNNVDFSKAGEGNNSTYPNSLVKLDHGTFNANNTTISGDPKATLHLGGAYSGTSGKVVMNMDGGSMILPGGLYIVRYTGGGTGTLNLNSGLISTAIPSAYNTFGNQRHYIGYATGSLGTLNISGGEYRVIGAYTKDQADYVFVTIGHNGTGVVNVAGTGRFSMDRLSDRWDRTRARVILGANSGSSGTLNLNEGGTFSTFAPRGIIGGDGASALVFNGGTFEAAGTINLATDSGGKWAWANLVETNVDTVAVGPKGGIVDTKGNDFHFMDPIVDLDALSAPEGFFAKRGSGTLIFHGANTYSAPTRIEAGGIAFADDGALSPNSVLWADSGVTVDLSGAAAQTVGGLAGKGAVANVALTTAGNIYPGGTNEIGTLTLSACSLTLASGARLVIDVDAQGNCDRLVVTGASAPLDISNLVVEVVGADADTIGPIISCDAGVTGKPQVIGTHCKLVSVSSNGDVSLSRTGFKLIFR